MLGSQGKGEIQLKCTQQAFPEFKDLLFGTIDNKAYIDGTIFLNSRQPKANIRNFFAEYRQPILALCDSYEIDSDSVYFINEEGHYLIDANLFCLFISFVEPGFLAYMTDRIYELFTNGVSVSDTYLIESVGKRFSPEILSRFLGDEASSD